MIGIEIPISPYAVYADEWRGWNDFLGYGARRCWAKEDAINDAKRFETKQEWRRGSSAAYCAARRRPAWWAEATAHMASTSKTVERWTKELAKASAQRFDSATEWRKVDPKAYRAAHVYGWVKELTSHMRVRVRNRWTIQTVLEDALKYKTTTEWRVNSTAHNAAHKFGIIEEATRHMNCRHFWSKEEVLADARLSSTTPNWKRRNSGAYYAAHRHGWFKEAIAHMIKPPRRQHKWPKPAVMATAKMFSTKTEWREAYACAAQSAKRNGWFEEATAHMSALAWATRVA